MAYTHWQIPRMSFPGAHSWNKVATSAEHSNLVMISYSRKQEEDAIPHKHNWIVDEWSDNGNQHDFYDGEKPQLIAFTPPSNCHVKSNEDCSIEALWMIRIEDCRIKGRLLTPIIPSMQKGIISNPCQLRVYFTWYMTSFPVLNGFINWHFR